MAVIQQRTFSRDIDVANATSAHIYDRVTGDWLCGITMPKLDLGLVIAACRELEDRGRKVIFEVEKP